MPMEHICEIHVYNKIIKIAMQQKILQRAAGGGTPKILELEKKGEPGPV